MRSRDRRSPAARVERDRQARRRRLRWLRSRRRLAGDARLQRALAGVLLALLIGPALWWFGATVVGWSVGVDTPTARRENARGWLLVLLAGPLVATGLATLTATITTNRWVVGTVFVVACLVAVPAAITLV